MKLGFLEILFLIGSLCTLTIRAYYKRANRKASPVVDSHHTRLDAVLLFTAMAAMAPVPLVYIFTPFLDPANFFLPDPIRWCGVPMLFAAVLVFWRAHADLGLNWSGYLEVKEQHQLVTHGIYRSIRHPMYAAILIWGLGQAMVLTNWIAGPANIIASLLFLMVRAPREETMLLERFGGAYRDYMSQTGRIIPRLARMNMSGH